MTDLPHNSPGDRLLSRLASLRATVRCWLIAYGVGVVIAGGALALVVTVTLDWSLHLPAPLRLTAGASFLVGGAVAAVYWVVRPLCARITPLAMALCVERRFPHLCDRISTAVAFLDRSDAEGSAVMRERVVRNAETIMDRLDMRRVVDRRRALGAVVVAVAAGLLLVSILAADSGWLRFGVSRYLHPFGHIDWPHRVEIVPLTGDRTVAMGDALTARMRIVRGASADLRAVLTIDGGGGLVTRRVMHRTGDIYRCRIDNVTRPFRYWFQAGDDDTRGRAAGVRVVEPPRVTQVRAAVHPPSYAVLDDVRVVDPTLGPIQAVAASLIDLTVRFNKPIGGGDHRVADPVMVIDDTTRYPLAIDPGDPTLLTGRLTATTDCAVRFEVADRHGFANRAGQSYAVRIVPDRPPVVTVTRPIGTLELTAQSVLQVAFRIQDDWGVATAAVETATDAEHPTWTVHRVMARPSVARPQSARLARAPDGVGYTATADVRLADLDLSAGGVLIWRASATDNLPGGGQIGYGPPMHVRLIEAAELERRLRADLLELEAGVRRISNRQVAVARRTARRGEATGTASTTDREAIGRLAADQRVVARDADDVADRVLRSASRLDESDPSVRALLDQLRQAATHLGEARKAFMDQAADRIADASREVGAREIADRLAEAHERQQQAIGALGRVLDALGRWGDFQQVVVRTRALLDRQQALNRETQFDQKDTLGLPVDRLDDARRVALAKLADRQRQLAHDGAQLVEQMNALASRDAGGDAAAIAALTDAVRAASAGSVVSNMRDAAYAIGQNRAMTAGLAQRQAETGLGRMLEALQTRRQRRLEHLVRHLEQHERTVAVWIRTQRDLLDAGGQAIAAPGATATSGAAHAFDRLARRQMRLADNVRTAVGDWEADARVAVIRDDLERAAGDMDRAAVQLVRRDARSARRPQTAALDALIAAHTRLLDAAEKTRREAFALRVAILRDKLDSIRGGQRDANEKTGDLIATRQSVGRLNRRIARRAGQLARRQRGLRDESAGLQTELGDAMVYTFVLNRAVSRMGDALGRLSSRDLDSGLADAQSDAIADLDLLVDALDDMFRLPPPDAYERGGGGGGDADGAASPPVPALAELLVLKSMQQALNQRTRAVAEAFDPEQATEATLQRVRGLAARQQKIEELTRQVVERTHAQMP